MGGFPGCQKEIMIKYHVIDALYNKGMESVEVKNTAATNGLKSGLTDAGGFVYLGPYAPGESIQIEVNHDGFDAVDQVITASEDVDFMMLGLNPTGPDLRLVLTWGPTPSDLDSRVVFFNDNGDEVCKLYWNNKKCDDYATLDVDETNGGDNGPETITIKSIAPGIKAMYYVYDYSNLIGRTMTWVASDAKANIFGPNGAGAKIVPLNTSDLDGKRYFVVGCFDSNGFTGFSTVGRSVDSPNVSNCP